MVWRAVCKDTAATEYEAHAMQMTWGETWTISNTDAPPAFHLPTTIFNV